jgi:muconolactone delta-isomerase
MEYLVTMTTHVPDGTLWRGPAGGTRPLGLWRARDAAEMRAILESLPQYAWMIVETKPLTRHPSDPVPATS